LTFSLPFDPGGFCGFLCGLKGAKTSSRRIGSELATIREFTVFSFFQVFVPVAILPRSTFA
jgi:hypothetical protein